MSDADKILAFLEEHWPKINKNEADLEKYFPAKRSNAEIETQRDLQKDIKHLLADIHDESLDDQSRSREMTVSRTMARFASLLAHVGLVLAYHSYLLCRGRADIPSYQRVLCWQSTVERHRDVRIP